MLTLGQTILIWRSSRGLSQSQLAQKAGLSRPNLSQIESGKRDVTVGTLRRIAFALQVNPGTLVDGEAPGIKKGEKLSRQKMELLAAAVADGLELQGQDGQRVADLAVITRSQRSALTGAPSSHRRGIRRENAAWLRLKATCSPEELQSLVRRITERVSR
jgi:transcriptional regulator with XRE-family HTH domain